MKISYEVAKERLLRAFGQEYFEENISDLIKAGIIEPKKQTALEKARNYKFSYARLTEDFNEAYYVKEVNELIQLYEKAVEETKHPIDKDVIDWLKEESNEASSPKWNYIRKLLKYFGVEHE